MFIFLEANRNNEVPISRYLLCNNKGAGSSLSVRRERKRPEMYTFYTQTHYNIDYDFYASSYFYFGILKTHGKYKTVCNLSLLLFPIRGEKAVCEVKHGTLLNRKTVIKVK